MNNKLILITSMTGKSIYQKELVYLITEGNQSVFK